MTAEYWADLSVLEAEELLRLPDDRMLGFVHEPLDTDFVLYVLDPSVASFEPFGPDPSASVSVQLDGFGERVAIGRRDASSIWGAIP